MTGSITREKIRQAPQKEGGEILCDPGWYVQKPDVQIKGDDNTHAHTTHILHTLPSGNRVKYVREFLSLQPAFSPITTGKRCDDFFP